MDLEEEGEGVDRVVILGNSHQESLSCSFVNSLPRLRSSIEAVIKTMNSDRLSPNPIAMIHCVTRGKLLYHSEPQTPHQ